MPWSALKFRNWLSRPSPVPTPGDFTDRLASNILSFSLGLKSGRGIESRPGIEMIKTTYHLVQANLAHARAELDDALMKDFVVQADEIDALAQGWPGFVDQPTLPDEGFIYTGLEMLNVSIWDSIEPLREFTYSGRHAEVLERRAEWFVQSDRPAYVLFWIPAGELPTEEQISQRFERLRVHGPTPLAFTFDSPYTPEEMLKFASEAP